VQSQLQGMAAQGKQCQGAKPQEKQGAVQQQRGLQAERAGGADKNS